MSLFIGTIIVVVLIAVNKIISWPMLIIEAIRFGKFGLNGSMGNSAAIYQAGKMVVVPVNAVNCVAAILLNNFNQYRKRE